MNIDLRVTVRLGMAVIVRIEEKPVASSDDLRHLADLLWTVARAIDEVKQRYNPPTEAPCESL